MAQDVRALREGRAVADLSPWVRVLVSGPDAGGFLGDLVTGPVAGLEPGGATASFLLSPTGRLRAAFTVARLGDVTYLLVQDPGQGERVGRLLEPYVLSSDVTIEPDERPLTAVLGAAPASLGEAARYAPGALGAGSDLVGVETRAASEALGLPVAEAAALEAWRILEGRPRLGVDLTAESLPHEARGFEAAIDFTKGCFLGQEAVAKVRNLGHPPFVIVPVRGDGLETGAPVLSAGTEVGAVTSAAEDPDGGRAGLVRIRWDAREAPLRTGAGAELERA